MVKKKGYTHRIFFFFFVSPGFPKVYLEVYPNLFGSVLVVVFQIIFYVEMIQNNFFYFLKIIFHINTLK
jgi:hypothetical protein